MLASAALSSIALRNARTGSPPAFRAVCAIVMVLALLTAGYGLYFPPHILLYAGVAIAGVAALLSILYESIFRNREDGSVSFLRLFRGARGMFVAGFGIAFILLAAALDDYWHRLYGLDATIWAPFHLMELFGSLVASIGVIYVLAGLANAARQARWVDRKLPRTPQPRP